MNELLAKADTLAFLLRNSCFGLWFWTTDHWKVARVTSHQQQVSVNVLW